MCSALAGSVICTGTPGWHAGYTPAGEYYESFDTAEAELLASTFSSRCRWSLGTTPGRLDTLSPPELVIFQQLTRANRSTMPPAEPEEGAR